MVFTVGADLVEVLPSYDANGQIMALAAANSLYEILTIMVKNPIH
jgi:agmatinase